MSARPWPTYMTAALAALILFAGRPARSDDLAAAPVPDSELAEMRGGYLVADGIQFNFGALLTTTVDGQLAFQTQVTYTPGGPQIAQTVGPNAVRGASVSGGTITGLNLQGFDRKDITLLNNGATALIQKVTGGGLQNIVINAADNQNIKQSTQMQLTLPDFAKTSQLMQQNLAMTNLMRNAQAGLVGH